MAEVVEDIGGRSCEGCAAREHEIERLITILRAIGALSGPYGPH